MFLDKRLPLLSAQKISTKHEFYNIIIANHFWNAYNTLAVDVLEQIHKKKERWISKITKLLDL